MTICIIGDSITWGAYLPFRGAWANLFRNYLESLNPNTAVYDLGIDGNTSKDLLVHFDNEISVRHPDAIMIAIGANDTLYRRNLDNLETTEADFSNNLSQLIEKAKNYTQKVILVGLAKGTDDKTVPLARSTTGKCYTKQRFALYDQIVQTQAQLHNCEYVKISDVLSDEDFDDGLHPNLGGHAKIFEAVRRNWTKQLPQHND